MKREELNELMNLAKIETTYKHGKCLLCGFYNGPQIQKAYWSEDMKAECDEIQRRRPDGKAIWLKQIRAYKDGRLVVETSVGKTWADALMSNITLMDIIKYRAGNK